MINFYFASGFFLYTLPRENLYESIYAYILSCTTTIIREDSPFRKFVVSWNIVHSELCNMDPVPMGKIRHQILVAKAKRETEHTLRRKHSIKSSRKIAILEKFKYLTISFQPESCGSGSGYFVRIRIRFFLKKLGSGFSEWLVWIKYFFDLGFLESQILIRSIWNRIRNPAFNPSVI